MIALEHDEILKRALVGYGFLKLKNWMCVDGGFCKSGQYLATYFSLLIDMTVMM